MYNYKSKNNFTKKDKASRGDSYNVEDYSESVKLYYKDLSHIPTLTKEEEKKLIAEHYKNGVLSLYARNRLLEGNLKFVFKVASFYRGSGVPMSELIELGNEGLMKALKKFDFSKEIRFYCYAIWWIRATIQSYLKKNGKQSSLTSSICENKASDDSDEEDNSAELWSDVETEDIINFEPDLFDSEDEVPESEDDDVMSEADLALDVETKDLISAKSEFFSKISSVLSEQEFEIIKLNFGFGSSEKKGLSVKKISERIGLKQSKVKSLKDKALKKLRKLAGKYAELSEMFNE